MSNTFFGVAIDCVDAAAVATFWAEVLGRQIAEHPTRENAAVIVDDATINGPRLARGSIDGLNFDMDRPAVGGGSNGAPDHANEFVTDEVDARQLGLHVGDVVPIGIYTNAQTTSSGFGTAAVPPHVRFDARLVGIVVLNRAVVQDDIDAGFPLLPGQGTPALTKPLRDCCVTTP
jgi:hypothetical protein